MSIPSPHPGMVIRYSYLWKNESERGKEEGLKNRPCAIVLTLQNDEQGDEVMVVPITHTEPELEDSIEIPGVIKSKLGLDGDRSWIILSELNEFYWPGPDLRPTDNGTVSYGTLPVNFFKQVKLKLLNLVNNKKLNTVKRTE